MLKHLLSLVLAAGIITGGVFLYKHRQQLFRPDFERSGGTLLAFEVSGPPPASGMEALAEVLRKRFDARDSLGIVVRVSDERQVEVGIPRGRQHDNLVEMVKRLAGRPGVVQYRFVATRSADEEAATALGAPATNLQAPPGPLKTAKGGEEFATKLPGAPAQRYRWAPLSESHVRALRLDASGLMRENPHDQLNVEQAWQSGVTFSPRFLHDALVQARKPTGRTDVSFFMLLREPAAGEEVPPPAIEDARVDSNGRHYLVALRFAPERSQRFFELVRKNTSPTSGQVTVAILLDGQLVATTGFSARRRDTLIGGEFDRNEADDVANLLRGGPLPCRLNPKPVLETTTPRR